MDNIAIETENVTKFFGVLIDGNLLWKQHINDFSRKVSKSIVILCKSREIVKQPLLKQLHLSFIYYHLNFWNIALAGTYKSKLERFYHHQKCAARIMNFKDKFTHAQSLLQSMKAMNIFQTNLFYII